MGNYMQNEPIVLESNTRFSESIIWQLQRDYFHREGIKAWDQVPYFITSNTFIANSYATLAVSFLRDYLQKNPGATQHPIYIIEMGVGTGQFSFYVLKRIQELCKEFNLSEKSFYYIMTDFTENNLKFWQSQPSLKEFVDKGMLDFAIYNMEEDDEIQLIVKGTALSKENIVTPIVVFANYIFDTVSHDCFNLNNNKISEVRINIATEKDNLDDKEIINLEKLNISFNNVDLELPYYEDSDLNQVLETYQNKLSNSNILIPISGLRSIAKLRKLSNDKLFIVSSDKGHTTLPQLEQLSHPEISFHGSFSLMVNFHAIAEYFTQIGGDSFFQTLRTGIKTCLFMSGFKLAELPETQFAANRLVEGFSPSDYFILHRYISDTFSEAHLELLATHLTITCYDPYMYHRLNQRICTLLPEADGPTVEYLIHIIDKIARNFYYIPGTHDIMFDIAYLHHTLKHYEQAFNYYEKSMEIFGMQLNQLYNSAICQYHMGENQEALKRFIEASKLNPTEEESQQIQEWITHCQ